MDSALILPMEISAIDRALSQIHNAILAIVNSIGMAPGNVVPLLVTMHCLPQALSLSVTIHSLPQASRQNRASQMFAR